VLNSNILWVKSNSSKNKKTLAPYTRPNRSRPYISHNISPILPPISIVILYTTDDVVVLLHTCCCWCCCHAKYLLFYTHTHTRLHIHKTYTHSTVIWEAAQKRRRVSFFFLTISVYYVRWVVLYPSVSSPPKSSCSFTLSVSVSPFSLSLFSHVSAVYSDITHSSIVLLNHGAYPYLLTMQYALLQPPHGCTTSTTTFQLYLLLVRRRLYTCVYYNRGRAEGP